MSLALLRLQDLVSEEMRVTEGYHLEHFIPTVRSDDTGARLLQPKMSVAVTPDQLTSTSVDAVGVYNAVWTVGRGEGLWLDYFSRGACSMAVFLLDNQASLLESVVVRALERIEGSAQYPSLVENYVDLYINTAIVTLLDGEVVNREAVLAYNYGLWWLCGHVKNMHKVKVKKAGRVFKHVNALKWLSAVLISRAERSVLEDV